MAIDFTLSPELEAIPRPGFRAFVREEIDPNLEKLESEDTPKDERRSILVSMRKKAHAAGIWLPHMPEEWGGMGLGHVELAMVQAEAAKNRYGPWVFNCQAPDEGNMHTMLHWATDMQKEKYLKPLCEGRAWSCFAMTEPEVAGSDPTLIRTNAYEDCDEWGHQRSQVVSSPTHTGRTSRSWCAAPKMTRTFRKRRTRPSSSISHKRAGTKSARSRRCTAAPATARS